MSDGSQREECDAEALEWASETCGGTTWQPLAGSFEQSSVWSGGTSGVPEFFLKKHSHVDHAQREWAMYAYLSKHGHRAFVKPIAQWVTDPRFILLTARRGQPVIALESHQWSQLGDALRHVHRRPVETLDPMPMDKALGRRLDRLTQTSKEPLQAEHEAFLRQAFRQVGEDRVWCHRDFGPHNWMVNPADGALWCLDFGQARPDYFLADFVQPRIETWQEETHWLAFQEGYARSLSSHEERIVWALVALHALGSLAWSVRPEGARARRHGHRSFQLFCQWFQSIG